MNWLSCKRVDSQHDDWVLWVVGIMVGIFTFEEKYENCNKLNRKNPVIGLFQCPDMAGNARNCPEMLRVPPAKRVIFSLYNIYPV